MTVQHKIFSFPLTLTGKNVISTTSTIATTDDGDNNN